MPVQCWRHHRGSKRAGRGGFWPEEQQETGLTTAPAAAAAAAASVSGRSLSPPSLSLSLSPSVCMSATPRHGTDLRMQSSSTSNSDRAFFGSGSSSRTAARKRRDRRQATRTSNSTGSRRSQSEALETSAEGKAAPTEAEAAVDEEKIDAGSAEGGAVEAGRQRGDALKQQQQQQQRDVSAGTLPFGTAYHVPVVCKEVLEWLVTDPEGIYVDCTLGGGGHSAALLSTLGGGARVIGLDRDPDALREASKRLADEADAGRFLAFRSNFADVGRAVRMCCSSSPLSPPAVSAFDVVNFADESEIREMVWRYGDEKRSTKIARAIVENRPIATTGELAEVVGKCAPPKERVKTLARVFQALRIEVNGELDALEALLEQAKFLVKPGGRLLILSYHSLEDRRVKRVLATGNLKGKVEKDFYGNLLSPWKPLLRKPLMAEEEEVALNPRARSVRLRVAERTDLPASSATPV
ncbi:unnamed protein product [Pylaiella littoralis]